MFQLFVRGITFLSTDPFSIAYFDYIVHESSDNESVISINSYLCALFPDGSTYFDRLFKKNCLLVQHQTSLAQRQAQDVIKRPPAENDRQRECLWQITRPPWSHQPQPNFSDTTGTPEWSRPSSAAKIVAAGTRMGYASRSAKLLILH